VGWEWLIAVAAIVFWIVQSLRGGEEDRARNRPRPSGEPAPAGRASRRPSTDIDRFLDEVNRRRRQTAERRPVVVVRETPAVAPPPARPRPVTRGPGPRPSPQSTVTRPVTGRPSAPLPVTVPGAVAEAVFGTPALAPPAEAGTELRPAQPLTAPPPPVQPASGVSRIEAMLSTPEDLQVAFILREIFGPPLCRSGRLSLRERTPLPGAENGN
jgi:hypothetical protein